MKFTAKNSVVLDLLIDLVSTKVGNANDLKYS